MTTTTLLVFLLSATAVAMVRADCGNIGAVPFGTDSIDQSGTPVCGWSAVLMGKNNGTISDIGLGNSWYAPDLQSAYFKPVTMPMGFNVGCPQVSKYAELCSLFPHKGNVYVRREFELDAEMVSKLKDIEVRYIVDNRIMKTYMNGVEFGFDYPHRANCHGVTRIDKFTIPASHLRAGKNVLALHAWDDGGMAFLDLELSFDVCAEGPLHACSQSAGPGQSVASNGGCRVRCAEENFCQNKESESCGASFRSDVEGSCLCESASSLGCSSDVMDVPSGVCYPSVWMTNEISRVVGCPPITATACQTEE